MLNIHRLGGKISGNYICFFIYFVIEYEDDMYEPDPMYAQVRKPKVKRVSVPTTDNPLMKNNIRINLISVLHMSSRIFLSM